MKNKTLTITLVSLFIIIAIVIGGVVFFNNKKEEEPQSPKTEMDEPECEPEVIEYWSDYLESLPEAKDKLITISTASQLAMLAKKVNEGNTYEDYIIKLTNDIDLLNREWTPIGYGYSEDIVPGFKGVFDGCNFTISNLKITKFAKGGSVIVDDKSVGSAGVGLFGFVNYGTVKNVKIDGAVVEGNHYTSALVGYCRGATISDCIIKNADVNCLYLNEEESGDKAGAICGYGGYGRIERCSAENSVIKADRDAGQILGGGGCSISNSVATGVIVQWNHSSENIEGYTRGGENIKEELVGRG